MLRTSFPESSPLLSANDLARRLNVSRRSIWRWRSAGKLPAPVVVGRLIRWRRDEIERWIAAGCPNRREWEAFNGKGASR